MTGSSGKFCLKLDDMLWFIDLKKSATVPSQHGAAVVVIYKVCRVVQDNIKVVNLI